MIEKKILLLSYNDSRFENLLMNAINQSALVETDCVMPYRTRILRIIRKVMLKYKFPGIGIWLGHWKKEIYKYSTIIIIASDYTPSVLLWIEKRYKLKKLINYYWDKVDISEYPVVYSSKFENWSFDIDDCKKYRFNYNPQYYSSHLSLPLEDIIYDISFVGADREGKWDDRTKYVNEYYDLFKNLGLKCYFYYVTNSKKSSGKFSHNNRISEKEFYRVISKSRAVLDIVQPEKEWITFRPLLTLSNKKKLITNNKKIANEPYYSKRNIFILGVDNISEIFTFIYSQFDDSLNSIIKNYEFDEWAKRFSG